MLFFCISIPQPDFNFSHAYKKLHVFGIIFLHINFQNARVLIFSTVFLLSYSLSLSGKGSLGKYTLDYCYRAILTFDYTNLFYKHTIDSNIHCSYALQNYMLTTFKNIILSTLLKKGITP